LRKLLWARQTYGLRGTARICRQQLGEIFSGLTRAGRRRRQREIEFDAERGIETRGTVSLFDLVIESPNRGSGLRHQPTPPELFRQIVGGLAIPFGEFVFVDLGSGKGRAVILAAEYPFKRVVGVEFSSELHAIARRNIGSCNRKYVRCEQIEVVCQDVVHFDFPDEPLVLYLYNPFLPDIVKRVVERLERSLQASPRPVHVIYVNPRSIDVFKASRWFDPKTAGNGWCVYASTCE
jgi:SAM-dependent methyltransferase